MINLAFRRASAGILFSLLTTSAFAQLGWLGDTRLFNNGTTVPNQGAYLLPWQSLTVTTQTWPISTNQTVTAVYTTDNWRTQREQQLQFDRNVGNNTQWYSILGPFPQGTNVQFYLRANHTDGTTRFDNNSFNNYTFTWRFTPAERRGAILQWFATDYRTMMARLPEIVQAGYSALYLPPPTKSGGGGFSVGYNPFDRFDLGDRLQMGTVATRYGTTQELIQLVQTAKRFGLEVYADLVLNHNDNRANNAINRYPDMIPEDFHIRSSADTGNNEIDFNNAGPLSFNMINHELLGLVDIAHENGNLIQTGAFNLPGYADFNMWGKPWYVRHPLNPHYYPGGRMVPEDSREYLRRWGWYLTTVIGFDGYRLDAVKHMTPTFFLNTQGQAGYPVNNGEWMREMYRLNPNANIFAEDFTSDSWELREFAKTGMNVLDFPLKQRMASIFNANGFGDLTELSNGLGYDTNLGLGFAFGGLDPAISVAFVHSHDEGPPTANNLAHAFMLTRPGQSIVYYDGNNLDGFDYNQFPRPGRYESLGNGSDGTIRLTDAKYRFGRGAMFNRFVSGDLYIYERHTSGKATMIVGLNDRTDTALGQWVDSAFDPGTVLEDLTGQMPNVTVQNDRRVRIDVPANGSSNNNNGRGYVVYVPITAKPDGTAVRVFDSTSGAEFIPQTVASPAGRFASATTWKAATLNASRLNIQVNTTAVGNEAFVQLDSGRWNPNFPTLRNTPEGITDGFVPMSKTSNGRFFLNNVNIAWLQDGLHMLKVRVLNNTGGGPRLWQDFYYWFYLNRGLGTGWVVDGNLQEFGPTANVWQSRSASSNSNRLDGLFVANDDQFLYLGLAGRVDGGEGFTNGVSLLVDTQLGTNATVGFGSAKDDSGPATRLLTNTRITLPSGFSPKLGIASFRNRGLSSSPEMLATGSPVLPVPVGAEAGTFRFSGFNPRALQMLRSAIAVQPRPSITSPLTGYEIAIPLSDIYQARVTPGIQLGFLAFLGTTGEVGSTLLSTDPLRGTLGGRPQAISWLTNQFLPPQQSIVGNPGTSPASATSFLTYNLSFAQAASISVNPGAIVPSSTSRASQTVTLTNNTGGSINGPIWLTVNLGSSFSNVITNARGNSRVTSNTYYFLVQAENLGAGESRQVTIEYQGSRISQLAPVFTPRAGRGIL